jgi:uracil-DNA glycosylase
VAGDAEGCRACPLWERGTQTVFGEGPVGAPALLVGEQPGDQEDLAGRPFVGPAGRLLDEALDEAGIDRSDAYVTNAVKHFKWKERGKRRIHERPNRAEVVACHRWLETELDLVDPQVVVLLGAVAGQAVLGPSFRVGASRGQVLDLGGRAGIATVHPSSVLRARSSDERRAARQGLVDDLRRAADLL